MINEGIITNDTKTLVKSEMIRQIHSLGSTNPDTWERSVFRALTGHDREDVDWEFEDNQAGYYLWVKTFDNLIEELVEDGYVRVDPAGDNGNRTLTPTGRDPGIEFSQLVYPS